MKRFNLIHQTEHSAEYEAQDSALEPYRFLVFEHERGAYLIDRDLAPVSISKTKAYNLLLEGAHNENN